MSYWILIFTALLALLNIVLTIKTATNSIASNIGKISIILLLILVFLQIQNEVISSKERNELREHIQTLIVNGIDEEEIAVKTSGLVNSKKKTISAFPIRLSKRLTGKEFAAVMLGIPVENVEDFEFVILDSTLKEWNKYIPFIPAKLRSKTPYYISVIPLTKDFLEEHDKLTVIYKYKTGHFDIKEHNLADLLVKEENKIYFVPVCIKNYCS